MTTLTISLPDDRARFAREQAEVRGFPSVDDYLDAVLREAQAREARRARIDALLIEGIESGPSEPMTPEDWASIEREVHERLEAERRDVDRRPSEA